ncbi:MAG: hypothetical protein WBY01_09855, partial [Pseudolabrys sp.]
PSSHYWLAFPLRFEPFALDPLARFFALGGLGIATHSSGLSRFTGLWFSDRLGKLGNVVRSGRLGQDRRRF